MVVISRQTNESVMFGDDLLVTVMQIRGTTAALRAVALRRPGAEVQGACDYTLGRDDSRELAPGILCTVVDVRGDKVRLGFETASKISVHRKEVYDAIRRENRAAAQVKPEEKK